MFRISLSDGLAIVGIALGLLVVVLDKAGKLKGPMLLILLALAATMTLPLVLGNSWVGGAPSNALKFTRGMSLVFLVGLGYSALAIWISGATAYDAFVKQGTASQPEPLTAPENAASKSQTGPTLPSDITWNFDGFLGMTGGGGQEPSVISFQAHGRNNLDEPIAHLGGFVRSDVTNMEFPIRFVIGGQRVRPDDTNGIPRKAEFDIASEPFPSSDPPREGLVASKFLVDFAALTFVFKYDDKNFVRHFTKDEVWRQVEAFRRVSVGSAPPSVTQKKPN